MYRIVKTCGRNFSIRAACVASDVDVTRTVLCVRIQAFFFLANRNANLDESLVAESSGNLVITRQSAVPSIEINERVTTEKIYRLDALRVSEVVAVNRQIIYGDSQPSLEPYAPSLRQDLVPGLK